MALSKRFDKLGTETAFAVSAEVDACKARGKRVYPFHLRDMNIKTPQNIIDATCRAMNEGKTGYCSNYGIPELREVLAENINRSHNTHYRMDNVAIQPGGKPVIGKFILGLMNPGDEVLYPNPGYPIYESQIEFNGGTAVPYTYTEDVDGFKLDIDAIEEAVTPRTKLLIFNDLQNPMAAEATAEERERIAELAVKHNLFVLLDEAYFDIRYEGQSTSLVSLPGMEGRSVILYTFSKKFAMTGWRLGAAVGPEEIIEGIAKLSVNDESCTNHFIQYGAIEGLTGDQSCIKDIIKVLKERRDTAAHLLNEISGIKCFLPRATFYLFPNVTQVMNKLGINEYEDFRKKVLEATGVSFCTRLHFGRPFQDEMEYYIRFAYSGIDTEDIKEGLGLFKQWIESSS
ncbi:MAG: aminotransferase class I/II-fold pyridoxal phosphate-dependent enzyme [Thermodesulfovibrionia bacterium]|nr:aminotransferase class I/II-fold pyridoxal phosphate-dependent enzyme [Thermodesulfovibrionia bacterium]